MTCLLMIFVIKCFVLFIFTNHCTVKFLFVDLTFASGLNNALILILTLLHSEWPKLHRVNSIEFCRSEFNRVNYIQLSTIT